MKSIYEESKYSGLIATYMVLLIVVVGFIYSLLHFKDYAISGFYKVQSALHRECSVSEVPITFDECYNYIFSSNPISLDAFSVTQIVLGKHETRNFEVLRANNGQLYLLGTEGEVEENKIQILASECELLYDATNEYGGCFIFVQVPYKNVKQASELQYYSDDNTEKSEDYLVGLIRNSEIPVLDLREYNSCKEYYHTDHHWTLEAAFSASNIISDEIERIYDIDLARNSCSSDVGNYNAVTYDNCFLGSIGIKVGPYYVGKDDFTILNPDFETDFTFKHFIDGELQFEYAGDFWDVFINQEILEDDCYNNKYDANMRGAYCESVIYNNNANNSFKGLLITHSYGRAMAQYMCFDYCELRYLDPQKGRYTGNLIEYIEEYQPDVVVFMYNDIVNVGDGFWEYYNM